MTITKIPRGQLRGNPAGGFAIEIMYPGLALTADDSGIGPIGRIDRALVQPGVLVAMHPHRDDEILTYIRHGEMLHRDTVGDEETLGRTRFMMMNAGHTFQHEELIIGKEPVQALQIFLRPNAPDLEPRVQFHEFEQEVSENDWRLLAGPKDAPLIVRAEARVYDSRPGAGATLAPPLTGQQGLAGMLYVFSGEVRIGGETAKDGEGVFVTENDQPIEALSSSHLVYFTVNLTSPVYRGGMFSGNQRRRQ